MIPAFKKQGVTSLGDLGEMSTTEVAELCDEVGMKPGEKRRLMKQYDGIIQTFAGKAADDVASDDDSDADAEPEQEPVAAAAADPGSPAALEAFLKAAKSSKYLPGTHWFHAGPIPSLRIRHAGHAVRLSVMPLCRDVAAFEMQGITSLACLGKLSSTEVAELCNEVGMKPVEKERLMKHYTAMIRPPTTLEAFLKAAEDIKYLTGVMLHKCTSLHVA